MIYFMLFSMIPVFTPGLWFELENMPTYRSSMGKYFYSSYPPVETSTTQYASDMGMATGSVLLILVFCALFLTIGGYFFSTVRDPAEDTASEFRARQSV
jgi:hypothetical protein